MTQVNHDLCRFLKLDFQLHIQRNKKAFKEIIFKYKYVENQEKEVKEIYILLKSELREIYK